jgi:calcium-dependent protein kinase
LERIKKFSSGGKLKQLTLNCIAHQCSTADINENQKIFINLDKNNDGYITKKELREGLKQMMKLSDDEIEQIILSIDTDKNGAINYTEFIAATLSHETVDQEKIIQAFDMMDKNGDGFIEESELAEMVGQEVGGIDVRMHKSLIKEADTDGDCKINIDEFKKMLLGGS